MPPLLARFAALRFDRVSSGALPLVRKSGCKFHSRGPALVRCTDVAHCTLTCNLSEPVNQQSIPPLIYHVKPISTFTFMVLELQMSSPSAVPASPALLAAQQYESPFQCLTFHSFHQLSTNPPSHILERPFSSQLCQSPKRLSAGLTSDSSFSMPSPTFRATSYHHTFHLMFCIPLHTIIPFM